MAIASKFIYIYIYIYILYILQIITIKIVTRIKVSWKIVLQIMLHQNLSNFAWLIETYEIHLHTNNINKPLLTTKDFLHVLRKILSSVKNERMGMFMNTSQIFGQLWTFRLIQYNLSMHKMHGILFSQRWGNNFTRPWEP